MSDTPDSASAAPADSEMSSAEVEALLDQGRRSAPQPDPSGVRPFDLVCRTKITRGTMPALDRVNERWIGEFQQELAERIRRPLEVSAANVQLVPYGEWLAPFPTPSSLNLYMVKPWRGNALVAVDARLLYRLVDAYYGGDERAPVDLAARSFPSRTEERLNEILVKALTTHFCRAFRPIAEIDLEFVRMELNPHYAAIATPSETVVVTALDVSVGEHGGKLCLVMPLSLLEPVRERLDEELRTASQETRAHWQTCLRAQLAESVLEVRGVFLETRITMKELLRLKAGDIWSIEMPRTARLSAGGVSLVSGKFGRSRGYNAIKINQRVERADQGSRRTSDERQRQ